MGPGATVTTCSGTTSTPRGSLNLSNFPSCISYTPSTNYVGRDTACIIICNNGVCDTTRIFINVTPALAYKRMDIKKTVDTVQLLPNGTFLVRFKIKAENLTIFRMDSVQIKDDLRQVFSTTNNFRVLDIQSNGTLIKNNLYDGSSVIDLVTNASFLNAKNSDSLYLSVIVSLDAPAGTYNNSAILQVKTPFGISQLFSNDPIVNPTNPSIRIPASFIIPRLSIKIPSGFSPNRDGIDDNFIITRPNGTRIVLQVLNRWGNTVYKNDDYKNDWDGRGPGNLFGEYLPVGTYYYLVIAIDKSGTQNKFAGPLTLVR
jgi:gliding motility-associated-like protein